MDMFRQVFCEKINIWVFCKLTSRINIGFQWHITPSGIQLFYLHLQIYCNFYFCKIPISDQDFDKKLGKLGIPPKTWVSHIANHFYCALSCVTNYQLREINNQLVMYIYCNIMLDLHDNICWTTTFVNYICASGSIVITS